MQEEVENRTLTLGINTTKFTGRVLKAALSKYLAHRKEKKLQASRDSPAVKPFGKISIPMWTLPRCAITSGSHKFRAENIRWA